MICFAITFCSAFVLFASEPINLPTAGISATISNSSSPSPISTRNLVVEPWTGFTTSLSPTRVLNLSPPVSFNSVSCIPLVIFAILPSIFLFIPVWPFPAATSVSIILFNTANCSSVAISPTLKTFALNSVIIDSFAFAGGPRLLGPLVAVVH